MASATVLACSADSVCSAWLNPMASTAPSSSGVTAGWPGSWSARRRSRAPSAASASSDVFNRNAVPIIRSMLTARRLDSRRSGFDVVCRGKYCVGRVWRHRLEVPRFWDPVAEVWGTSSSISRSRSPGGRAGLAAEFATRAGLGCDHRSFGGVTARCGAVASRMAMTRSPWVSRIYGCEGAAMATGTVKWFNESASSRLTHSRPLRQRPS